MEFNDDEKTKIKAMLLYLVKKRHNASGGLGGFHLLEIQPLLNELIADGEVVKRPTINHSGYFLLTNNNN